MIQSWFPGAELPDGEGCQQRQHHTAAAAASRSLARRAAGHQHGQRLGHHQEDGEVVRPARGRTRRPTPRGPGVRVQQPLPGPTATAPRAGPIQAVGTASEYQTARGERRPAGPPRDGTAPAQLLHRGVRHRDGGHAHQRGEAPAGGVTVADEACPDPHDGEVGRRDARLAGDIAPQVGEITRRALDVSHSSYHRLCAPRPQSRTAAPRATTARASGRRAAGGRHPGLGAPFRGAA